MNFSFILVSFLYPLFMVMMQQREHIDFEVRLLSHIK